MGERDNQQGDGTVREQPHLPSDQLQAGATPGANTTGEHAGEGEAQITDPNDRATDGDTLSTDRLQAGPTPGANTTGAASANDGEAREGKQPRNQGDRGDIGDVGDEGRA